MAFVAAGAAMALTGMGVYVAQGSKQNLKKQKIIHQRSIAGYYTPPDLIINDEHNIRYDDNQPVLRVDRGDWGIPRTYVGQDAGRAKLPAYGRPQSLGLWNP